MKITKEMFIGDMLRKYPDTIRIFTKHKMGCIGCGGAMAETLERGALMHGLDIKTVLTELNGITASRQKQ